jgi:hypothetical protein
MAISFICSSRNQYFNNNDLIVFAPVEFLQLITYLVDSLKAFIHPGDQDNNRFSSGFHRIAT